jgi:hypothetical protein
VLNQDRLLTGLRVPARDSSRFRCDNGRRREEVSTNANSSLILRGPTSEELAPGCEGSVNQASELTPPATDVVVTLVHGTWAHGAAWTQPNSPFCKQLTEELHFRGVAKVTFPPFKWSGGNTHLDRRLASIQLRKHLRRQLRTEPAARHYVVAHSHGGNVTLRAVRNSPALCQKVSGIAAIATPFLTFRQRSLRLALLRPALQGAISAVKDTLVWLMVSRAVSVGILFQEPLFLVCFSMVIALVLLMYRHLIPHVVHWLSYNWAGQMVTTGYQVFAIFVAAVMVVVALLWGWDEATDKNTKKLRRESRSIFLRYSYSQPETSLTDIPVFALSSFLDEAYGVLTGSWWMHRATGWGVRFGISAALLTTLLVTTAVEYELARQMFATMSHLGWATLLKTASPILLGGSIMLAIWLASTLIGLFLVISGRSSLGLGLSDPDDNLLCEVRARRDLPLPIRTTKQRYSTWQLLRHSKGALFHSRIYFHPPAIHDIAAWISSPHQRTPALITAPTATRPSRLLPPTLIPEVRLSRLRPTNELQTAKEQSTYNL